MFERPRIQSPVDWAAQFAAGANTLALYRPEALARSRPRLVEIDGPVRRAALAHWRDCLERQL